jgi:hypothetical protein
MALVFALGAKLLLSSEANGTAGKTFLLPPTQVGTDLQKKPDHARVGISAEWFELLQASKEKWLKSSGRTVWEIHAFALLLFFVPKAVQDVIIFVYRTILIYILNCCYRI